MSRSRCMLSRTQNLHRIPSLTLTKQRFANAYVTYAGLADAAVTCVGFAVAAAMYTGLVPALSRTKDKETQRSCHELFANAPVNFAGFSDAAVADRFCKRSCHAHRTRTRFRHVRWTPSRSCYNTGLTDAIGWFTVDWSVMYIHKLCCHDLRTRKPSCLDYRTRKRSSHERWTRTCRTSRRPVRHSDTQTLQSQSRSSHAHRSRTGSCLRTQSFKILLFKNKGDIHLKYVSHNVRNIQTSLSEDLDNVPYWLRANKLTLNMTNWQSLCRLDLSRV